MRRPDADSHQGDGPYPDRLEQADDADLARLLARRDLPASFERWQVILAPRATRHTHASEWAGALVLVAQGRLEVACEAGGHRTFSAGDLLVFGWLPLRTLHNPGPVPVRLVAVRRCGVRPSAGLLRVIR
jgi:hypothetical protein